MAIRSNRHYNNPEIGAAFSNLAQMFAPPSAQDVYAYSKAAETKQNASRLAELFDYAKRPDFDRTMLDRLGIAAGRYNPNQSFYAVDQGNLVSRDNNAADNTRALQQTEMQQRGETTRTMLAPVGAGATRFVPPSMAEFFGVPEQQVGVLTANPGETVRAPDGTSLQGIPKPLTKSEVEGAILRGLPQNEQRVAAIGSAPVQEVLNPDTNLPEIAFQADSIGRRPYERPTSTAKPTNGMALLPDKTRVPAVQGPDGKWRHAQTGEELPPGVQIFDLPRPTGTNADLGIATTTANTTAANAQEAEVIRAMGTLDIYENLLRDNPGAIGLVGLIRGTAQNAGQVVTDLTRAFGDKAPAMQEAAQEIQAGLKGVAPEMFDQSIPEAAFLQSTLAYAIARTENPSGEVSRQAYERALERIQGGALSNTASALASTAAMRKVLDQQIQGIRSLRSPGGLPANATGDAPAAPPAQQGGPARWGRDATGKPVRIQ